MRCAWKEFLGILPPWIRRDVDRQGGNTLQELRLRLNGPPELIFPDGIRFSEKNVSREDLVFCINTASKYSPWAAATMAKGYITAPGGHRIGLCGTAVCQGTQFSGIREVSSLCIRVARDHPGIAPKVSGSVLILGAPGWGKTTLLRDLCRQIGQRSVLSVVDERGELFPEGFQRGNRMDVLTGCPKAVGIGMLLRVMGPQYIALDEITDPADCEALIQAANCGVQLLATAHAASREEFYRRQVYRRLIDQKLFDTLLILRQDKTYITERMTL